MQVYSAIVPGSRISAVRIYSVVAGRDLYTSWEKCFGICLVKRGRREFRWGSYFVIVTLSCSEICHRRIRDLYTFFYKKRCLIFSVMKEKNCENLEFFLGSHWTSFAPKW